MAVIYSTGSNATSSAQERYGRRVSLFVARFLEARLQSGPKEDLGSDASFLYVLLSREPATEGEILAVNDKGPVIEFGFGESPAAPEEWESVPLHELIASAVRWLAADP